MLIDIQEEVYEALKRAAEHVYPSVPDVDAQRPCVSYFESNNIPDGNADDEEYTSLIEYTVDVWGDTPEEITPIAQRVEAEMSALGFERTHCTDIPPGHKNMMYQITI